MIYDKSDKKLLVTNQSLQTTRDPKTMPSYTDQDICNFFIKKSKTIEETSISEAKAWLLTGRSMIPKNFQIQLQSYLLEKRQKNAEGCARCFEALFRMFPMEIIEEVNEIANAVKAVTLSTMKESDEEIFLNKVFNSLPVGMRMEVLMHRSEHTPILLEKCQSVLLMVKLFPDVVNQHGGNMLYTLSGCDADVHSPFRSHLVTELVPAVLRLCKNLQPSPALITLLNQCIEYYVLVDNDQEKEDAENDSRWDKLYGVVDQIGSILNWSIAPFFRDAAHSTGSTNVEMLLQSLCVAVQHRSHYTPTELAYIAVVIFLRCITAYYEKLSTSNVWKFSASEKAKLTLVEVFIPPPTNLSRNESPDPNLSVITTVSSNSSLHSDPSQLLQYFNTATKIWQLIQSLSGDRLEKEFFVILSSMNSLNFEKWSVFQEFEYDYKTYVGQHQISDANKTTNLVKLASMHCGLRNFKSAAEFAIKAVNEISTSPTTPTGPVATSPPVESKTNPFPRSRSISGSFGVVHVPKQTNFSFFNCPSYATTPSGCLVPQRRVHFISENKSEVLAYAVNILIQCFQSQMEIATTHKDDLCTGHLMTLLQLEWYSPPADMLLTQILDMIRSKGTFRYFPYFADFIIEGDILEQFMALGSNQDTAKPIVLDIFSGGNDGSVSGSTRRMGTRGVERGAKNDFKLCMKKQMLKNARENLESLIIKFLTLNKVDIFTCLEGR
ncbi:Integrator complex subunit 10 [Orchesella cincta]|uniref:Integrator complex subunit 10 n=1 Tax=Orchesella cincta TaxID=48709 RepID=A0A1D2NIA5_ORCCI|nr:Integrator complex subunit 10 [Orchesella cincta]